jgi:hypothetical protein
LAPQLEYDLEWLAVLRATHELTSRSRQDVLLPREMPLVSQQDKDW